MIYQGQTLAVKLLDNGVAELCFDNQNDSVNKFDEATLNELKEATAKLAAASDVKGVLVTSGKGVFIVGADITEFIGLFAESEETIVKHILGLNDIFNAFEDLPFPTCVAINGAAMGGGYEMCLAADYRVMSSKAVLGLPEVKLGINPGFGGTVRLPRLIGIDNAVEWACTGKDQRPAKALAAGGVDAVVEPDDLREAGLDLLAQAIAGDLDYKAVRSAKTSPVQLNDMERMMAFTTGKSVVAAQSNRDMPAPLTAAKSMEKSSHLDRAGAIQVEAEHFAKLAKTTAAQALVGLFLNEQSVSRRSRKLAKQAHPVKQAAVLGAGIMGGGIAYQSAVKGTPVIMKDIAEAGLEQGMDEASKLLAKQVDRGRLAPLKMGAVLSDIRPTLDYTGFDKVDIAVEAVVENPKVKKMVLAEVESKMSDKAVLASNTSTISIDSLAEALERPEQFCGMHFFNPVHRMPLVEVIQGAKSSEETIATTVAYALKMGKTPIVVKDCPGFYVNRVLFPYFAGFNFLVRDGVDFQQIDKVMEKFGWPMGPAYLLDVVGMDTAKHAADVMAEGFPDRMKHPEVGASELIYAADRYGQKNGVGFYKYEADKKGRPQKLADEATQAVIAPAIKGSMTLSDEEIIDRMMIPMCNEVVRCLEEGIVSNASDADLGLIMGLGFPVYRGGAVRWMETIGLKAFVEKADKYADLGGLYKPTDKLREMAAANQSFFA